jgi:hypothetical protein
MHLLDFGFYFSIFEYKKMFFFLIYLIGFTYTHCLERKLIRSTENKNKIVVQNFQLHCFILHYFI